MIQALAELVKAQGAQIVELSKALAIAHEHHAQVPVPVLTAGANRPERMYLTEEEEDDQFSSPYVERAEAEAALSNILEAANLDASHLSIAP